jgi:ribonuclease J
MSQIRIYALGGLDEDGKNLSVVEIDRDIYILDAGLKYPEGHHLGVEIVIPDIKNLVERKSDVKAIFITHGHDDAMGALPFLLKQIDAPVYTSALTAALLETLFKEKGIKNYVLKIIDRNGDFNVQGRLIKTFGLTHSIADAFGVAIDSDHGYVVYAPEFIIDFNNRLDAFNCDITQFAELGKKGVFALLTESIGADRSGFTAPNHRITDYLENAFENAKGRVIVTMYEQNLYRLIEVIEQAKRFKKKVFFYNAHQRNLLAQAEILNYYKLPIELEVTSARFNNELDDIVIIISGSGINAFRSMHKIAISEDDKIQLRPTDTILIASPVVPGTEIEAGSMENELYKEDVKVISLDKKKVFSMHAAIEDIKMLMYLTKPKYFIPIHGEYRHLIANANVALDMGYYADKIVVLDNGQIAEFKEGKLNNTATILPLDEVLIDGYEKLDYTGLVLKDRETLSTDGVIVVGVSIDFKTKSLLGGPDVQSRGVIYLKDSEHILKEVAKIMELSILELLEKQKYENSSARNEARERISKYIYKETGKKPLVLPVIIELNLN